MTGDYGFNPSRSTVECDLEHTIISVTKQYNFVPTKHTVLHTWLMSTILQLRFDVWLRVTESKISADLWAKWLGKDFTLIYYCMSLSHWIGFNQHFTRISGQHGHISIITEHEWQKMIPWCTVIGKKWRMGQWINMNSETFMVMLTQFVLKRDINADVNVQS